MPNCTRRTVEYVGVSDQNNEVSQEMFIRYARATCKSNTYSNICVPSHTLLTEKQIKMRERLRKKLAVKNAKK